MKRPRIGLALGSGSARGWAHIGVIRALHERGIQPDIICGSSIGALVGAAYASGNLDVLEEWVRALTFWDVVKLLDVRLSGGLIEGEELMMTLHQKFYGRTIESLSCPFTAVATELNSGKEIWLQQGDLSHAVRASIALPGLFSPIKLNNQWLVDGGIVNPVPVSVARAMGAEFIIAVNLNDDLLGRHMAPQTPSAPAKQATRDLFNQMLERINQEMREKGFTGWELKGLKNHKPQESTPGLFEVMASAINIMQVQITRTRMAGEQPDMLLAPKLGHLGILEFDRATEAIEEGRAAVERNLDALQPLLLP